MAVSKSGTVPTLGHLPNANLGMLIRLLTRLVEVATWAKFAQREAINARRKFRFIAATALLDD